MRVSYEAAALAKRSGRKTGSVFRPITATKALEDEFRAITRTIPAAWADQVKATILPAYEARRAGLIRDDATDVLRSAVGAAANALFYTVEAVPAAVRRFLERLEAWHRHRFGLAVRAAIGIDATPYVSPDDVRQELEVALERSVALIRGLSDDLRKQVASIIWEAAANSLPRGEAAAQIAARLDIARSRADLIARDQTATLTSQLTRVRARQAGSETYTWSTSRDERVRGNPQGRYPRAKPSHWAREGKTFRWDQPPSDGHPGEPINCRCVALPQFEV